MEGAKKTKRVSFVSSFLVSLKLVGIEGPQRLAYEGGEERDESTYEKERGGEGGGRGWWLEGQR